MKYLAILGSTGSIGQSTLAVVAEHPGEFAVAGLAAGQNVKVLAEQIRQFCPALVSVQDEAVAAKLRELLPPTGAPEILWGAAGARDVAMASGADLVVSAMVGAVGLEPTLAAIQAGLPVALANKETLVAAGPLVMAAGQRTRRAHHPGGQRTQRHFSGPARPAPGGCAASLAHRLRGAVPLLGPGAPAQVTAAQALKHPNWSMGPKITIDSATMMNKALEVIEASVLFGLPVDQVGVYIHPQSIIHSLVEFVDGSVIAQLGVPDMRLPIAYALTYPRRLPLNSPPLDLCQVARLTFETPDMTRFPGLALGYAAARAGGTMPAVLNAANEVAVAAFLDGRLRFLDIPQMVEQTMAAHQPQPWRAWSRFWPSINGPGILPRA